MYEERFYRNKISSNHNFEISYKESDIFVSTSTAFDKNIAFDVLKKYYREIEDYIRVNPLFMSSFSPLDVDERAPDIVKDMLECSSITGIGPFACVAGAIALYVGNEILHHVDEIIVENGGDIFLKINNDKIIGVYLGERFGTEEVSLKIKKRDYPFGIASSSAHMGPSLNFGNADLVMVVAKDAILADGFATALSNRVRTQQDINDILDEAKNNSFLEGLLIAFDSKLFLWGQIEVC